MILGSSIYIGFIVFFLFDISLNMKESWVSMGQYCCHKSLRVGYYPLWRIWQTFTLREQPVTINCFIKMLKVDCMSGLGLNVNGVVQLEYRMYGEV